MAEDADRVLPATPRRREEARRQGVVPRSADLTGAAALLAGVVALGLFGARAMEGVFRALRESLASIGSVEPEGLPSLFVSLAGTATVALLPVIVAVLAAAIGMNLLQVGFLFRSIGFRLPGRTIDPADSAARLAGGVLKAAAVVSVAALTLWADFASLVAGAATIDALAYAFGRLTWLLAVRSGLALLVLGLLDYAYRRWKHERDLRLTPAEMREELRADGGDPQIRRKRRDLAKKVA